MSDIAISTVHGTEADPVSGLPLVERYLEKTYLKEREFMSPLAQSAYFSKRNLPKMAGQFIRFTRRLKGRLPEVATSGADPESGFNLAYSQLNCPIEFLNDYCGIHTQAQLTSWIDLAKDAKEVTTEALTRYLNRAVQAAFLAGRFKPGKRNSSGVTVGDASYPHFWTTAEATVSMFGLTFNFRAAPKYYGNKKDSFANLAADDFVTMNDFASLRVRLASSGAPTVNGKYIAVISYAIQADLQRDDKYFAAAIRDQAARQKVFAGELADYAGFHWVLDDEPWTLALGGNGVTLEPSGTVHVAQVFGQDAFSYMRLGGVNSAKPTFKVQDISKTGSLMTIGWMIPFQTLMTQNVWAANVIAPVRDPGSNGNPDA